MPRGYAWVMTLATVPTVTLALFAVGPRVQRGRRDVGAPAGRRRAPDASTAMGTDLFWLICARRQLRRVALARARPIFGGTKHWMTAYPFLALFAGAGFDAVVRAARRELVRHRRRSPAARRLGARARGRRAAILGAAVFAAPIDRDGPLAPVGLSALHAARGRRGGRGVARA